LKLEGIAIGGCKHLNEKNIKVSFVILHYLALEDTIECIDSIISNLDISSEIVVVDNASNNGSVEELEKYYKGKRSVHILKMKYNSGFAKGNNHGYQYAKQFLHSDFIVLLNNDTIIKQKDFVQKVNEIYQREKFDIMGPDIISLVNNVHQNPVALCGMDDIEIEKAIKNARRNLLLNSIGYLSLKLTLIKFIKNILHVKRSIPENKLAREAKKNPLLHGSCLIFARNYIEKYNGLFSDTFMFGEEDILWYISQREKLKVLYSPELRIYHKEDASTNILLDNGRKKREFIYSNSLKSLLVLRDIQKNNSIYLKDIIAQDKENNRYLY